MPDQAAAQAARPPAASPSAERCRPPMMGAGGPAAHGRFMGSPSAAEERAARCSASGATCAHQRGALIATAVLVVLTTGLNLLGPYLLGVAIDRYILPGDLPGLARICVLMLAASMPSVAAHLAADLRDDRRRAAHGARHPQRPVRQAADAAAALLRPAHRTAT